VKLEVFYSKSIQTCTAQVLSGKVRGVPAAAANPQVGKATVRVKKQGKRTVNVRVVLNRSFRRKIPGSIGGIAIDPSILPSWTKQHHLGKLASFYGPGFVEIRDRRVLPVNRFIIDDQDYLAAVYGLDRSLDANGCPARILADLVDNDLVLIFGENAIWLPYRIVRWPIPSVILLEDGAPTLSSADE